MNKAARRNSVDQVARAAPNPNPIPNPNPTPRCRSCHLTQQRYDKEHLIDRQGHRHDPEAMIANSANWTQQITQPIVL